MGLPTLTVVVPNYNHAKLLPVSLSALCNQSVPALEIIVVDDASTDHSVEVIRSFAQKHPFLRLHRNEQNRGVNYNLNLGLKEAKGDFIFFPAADDEVMPGLFEKSMRLLAEHPQAGLSCAIAEWRETFSGLTWHMGAAMAERPSFFSPDEMVRLGQRRKLYIVASNCFMRTDMLREAGGFIPELRWHSDWFANYVIGFRRGICFVPEVLSVANLLEGSFFQSRKKLEHEQVLLKLLELLNSEKCADVRPRLRDAGELALFGKPMMELLRNRPECRHFINATLRRKIFRRRAELWAKKYFPAGLSRLLLKIFYQKSPPKPAAN